MGVVHGCTVFFNPVLGSDVPTCISLNPNG